MNEVAVFVVLSSIVLTMSVCGVVLAIRAARPLYRVVESKLESHVLEDGNKYDLLRILVLTFACGFFAGVTITFLTYLLLVAYR